MAPEVVGEAVGGGVDFVFLPFRTDEVEEFVDEGVQAFALGLAGVDVDDVVFLASPPDGFAQGFLVGEFLFDDFDFGDGHEFNHGRNSGKGSPVFPGIAAFVLNGVLATADKPEVFMTPSAGAKALEEGRNTAEFTPAMVRFVFVRARHFNIRTSGCVLLGSAYPAGFTDHLSSHH